MNIANIIENARYLSKEGALFNTEHQSRIFSDTQTKERAEAMLKALQGLSYASAVNLLELCKMAMAQAKID